MSSFSAERNPVKKRRVLQKLSFVLLSTRCCSRTSPFGRDREWILLQLFNGDSDSADMTVLTVWQHFTYGAGTHCADCAGTVLGVCWNCRLCWLCTVFTVLTVLRLCWLLTVVSVLTAVWWPCWLLAVAVDSTRVFADIQIYFPCVKRLSECLLFL